jgi:excisionase family DNA binding protein
MALHAVKPNQHNTQTLRVLTIAQLMTPEQCAEFLQVQVDTLYVWVSQRKIPFRKAWTIGTSALRFDFDEVNEWSKGAKCLRNLPRSRCCAILRAPCGCNRKG